MRHQLNRREGPTGCRPLRLNGSVTAVGDSAPFRELEHLGEENARLSRLLHLRTGETTPAAEQPVMPVASPGLVTMSSSVSAKLELFADRFAARRDVYAVRWDNTRKGTSGWSPAIIGSWRKGIDKRSVRYLPLTQDVIAAHLAGDVFVGLYPLLPGNQCRWVAADFDGATAMLDALAFVKAASSHGVPSALEVSQSGRGAHVWILFCDDVPSATARAIGTLLVHEAIVLRGSMDLRSYDRLFPNQDVLPNGGFGNLIAAPLQGRRRRDGLTVFLDLATLEPHEDQWEFLSTLDRLTLSKATHLGRLAARAAVGGDLVALERSTATRVQPRMPAVIRAELGSGLSLDAAQLTPAACPLSSMPRHS